MKKDQPKFVGFEISPEELAEGGLIRDDDFEILAYTPPGERSKPTIINVHEYEEARRDPRVIDFLKRARECGENSETI